MFNRDCLLIALALAFACTGCSKRETPLESALSELRRLGSSTQAALKLTEYSDQLSAAKVRIDAAFQQTKDDDAKLRIEKALNWYLEAQIAWKRNNDTDARASAQVRDYWSQARQATEFASEYALAKPPKRQKLWETEMAAVDATIRASEEAAKQGDEEQKARQARQAEAEARRQVADEKKIVETARTRRFAPEGTVYNLKRITFTTPDGLTSFAPGTELQATKKTSSGMLWVQKDELEAEVPTSSVTNDLDLVAVLRTAPPVRRTIHQAGRRSASNEVLRANPVGR
jgi:hypothetical protein